MSVTHRANNSETLKKRDMEKLVLCSVIYFWPLYRSPNMFSQSTYRPGCVCHRRAASVGALLDFSEGNGSFQEADWTWWPHLVPQNQNAAMLACVWLCLFVGAHVRKGGSFHPEMLLRFMRSLMLKWAESKRFLMRVFKHAYLCVCVCVLEFRGRITELCARNNDERGKLIEEAELRWWQQLPS